VARVIVDRLDGVAFVEPVGDRFRVRWVCGRQPSREFATREEALAAAHSPEPPPPAGRVPPEVVEAIVELRRRGWGPHRIARALASQGVPTARGGCWHSATVRKVLDRELAVKS
jgi:Recombinase